jgi:hypothetical protein
LKSSVRLVQGCGWKPGAGLVESRLVCSALARGGQRGRCSFEIPRRRPRQRLLQILIRLGQADDLRPRKRRDLAPQGGDRLGQPIPDRIPILPKILGDRVQL